MALEYRGLSLRPSAVPRQCKTKHVEPDSSCARMHVTLGRMGRKVGWTVTQSHLIKRGLGRSDRGRVSYNHADLSQFHRPNIDSHLA